MNALEILSRIEERLKTLRLSAKAASEQAGGADLIRNWRRAAKSGKPVGMTMTSLRRLAPILKASVSWLVTGEGEPSVDAPAPEFISAPVLSWVSASGLEAPDYSIESAENLPHVYAPGLDQEGDWIALKVEGTSMDRISPPESIIFVNRRDRRLVPNACYVIRDAETGEATYKRYRPGPDRWEPVTFSEEHDTIFPAFGRPIEVIGRVRLSMIAM